MKENNLMILVFYLPSCMDIDEMVRIGEQIRVSLEDKNCLHYVLPTDKDVRVECLNPVVVSEEEYAETKSLLDKLKEEFIDSYPRNI